MAVELDRTNEDSRIDHHNYWQSVDAEQGQCLVTGRQDVWCLLVPPTSLFNLAKARGASQVRIGVCCTVKGLLSLGFNSASERSGAYVYWLGKARFAPALRSGRRGILSIWTPSGWVKSVAAHITV